MIYWLKERQFDELKIVIVRDIGLQDLMSINAYNVYRQAYGRAHSDAGHSRVNRVFKDKSGGVIVDYLGILDSLKGL